MKKISDLQLKNYLERLMETGEEGFIDWVVQVTLEKFPSHRTPDIDCLDLAEGFFSLYRRTGEEIHFKIGRLLRRAAHISYRKLKQFHRKDGFNPRFLQMLNK